LLLMPIASPDYLEISKYNEIVQANIHIKAKELIIGATYKTKQNEELIYMGKFDYYGWRGNDKKQFWFCDNPSEGNISFTQFKALGDKLIQVVDGKCCDDYANLFDVMECKPEYSPIDSTKDEFEYFDLEYFIKTVNEMLDKNYYWCSLKIYCDLGNDETTLVTIDRKNSDLETRLLKATKKSVKMEKYNRGWYNNVTEYEREVEYDEVIVESENLEDIFTKLQPQYKNIYLVNGKLKGGRKNNE